MKTIKLIKSSTPEENWKALSILYKEWWSLITIYEWVIYLEKEEKNTRKKSKEIVTSTDTEIIEYWKPEVNDTLAFLYKSIWIKEFKETKQMQRNFANHIYNLFKEIWNDEVKRRLILILCDPFKKKNCNSIKYLYGELKSVPVWECIVPEQPRGVRTITV